MKKFICHALAVLFVVGAAPCLIFAQEKPQKYNGNITNLNRKATFSIKMKANHVYTIDLESKAFDTFLEIRDGAGKIIAEDDDGGQGLNSRLLFIPAKSAAFQVVARPLGVRTGPFSLTVRPAKVELAVNGELTRQDPLDRIRNQSHHKVHTVKLKAGVRYQIDLTSRKFDTYLRLEDAGGTNLAQNDDGGDGLNSRLSFQPTKTGDYRIIVTAFLGDDLGRYILMVRKE